jgi:hypothetical protein
VVNPPRELWGTSRYSVPFHAPSEWYAIELSETVLMQITLNNLTILLLVITCTTLSRFRFNQKKIINFTSSNERHWVYLMSFSLIIIVKF